MKLQITLLLTLIFSSDAFANKNLILRPKVVTYQYDGGYTVTIKTNQTGESLASVEISKGTDVISVPSKEFESVQNPVLNNVIVSGGTKGSKAPSCVTIGYGAHQCYSGKCPREISYCFANGKYSKSYKTIN